eukprot:s3355_g6.t1
MACIKTTSKGSQFTIQDPTETPNALERPPIVLLVGAGIQLILLLYLMFKAVQREKKILSDVLHILFFFFGSAGFGLYGVATLIMAVEPVGSSKLTTIISRLLMVASWASLLLNCCCLMESITMPVMGRLKMSENSLRILFHIFSLLLIFAAFVVAAVSTDHLLSTLAFLSVICGTCAVSFLRAAYVDHLNNILGSNTMKSLGTFFGCVALMVAAILEPICGYAAHKNGCYEGCGVPGFHILGLVVLLLGTWLLVGLWQGCSPDAGTFPTFRISSAPTSAKGPLAAAFLQLADCEALVSADHGVVQLALMEIYVRYGKLLAFHPDLFPRYGQRVLQALVSRGIRSSNPHVVSRACFMFGRFLKLVKAQAATLLTQIHEALQD